MNRKSTPPIPEPIVQLLGREMKLRSRIERLELRKGGGNPAKLTIAFFDSVVDGTISNEEFAGYVPALHEVFPDLVQEIATDICE